MTFLFLSCHDDPTNPNQHLTLAYYASLDTQAYALNSRRVWEGIDSLARNDRDSTYADYAARRHYSRRQPFIWLTRLGVDNRADTLLAALRTVGDMGFSPERFQVGQIERDLRRLRALDFDATTHRVNQVAARLEYNLTKAYLRYAVGQRFGYVNVKSLLNKLDVLEKDSGHVSYRRLYDIESPYASRSFVQQALGKVRADSLGDFFREISPRGPLYRTLLAKLQGASADTLGRSKILVNLERCRWRMPDYTFSHRKYALVNIPSYHLRIVDGDTASTMRIAFGSIETKTPIMISKVKRMDINPQWIMPRSIIKSSILPRLGNSSYFAQRQYFIRNRKTGETVSPRAVTAAMLLSGQYLVGQRGGEGNALGRIIFRFDNDLAIYLHDTSSREVFSQSSRDVSHGCVRVEHPFEFAVFLLGDKDERIIEKIRYSMQADVSPLGIPRDQLTPRMLAVADTLQRKKLVGSVNVTPQVPIFILYFTLYPDHSGRLESFADVYGYDKVIYRALQNYI